MKFLSVSTLLLAAVASAGSASRQTRPLRSRYELSLSAPFDAPYNDGALSLRDNKAGFWPSQPDALVVSVEGDEAQGARLSVGSGGDGFLALAGDGGLRDLVLVDEDGAADAAGFAVELRDDGDGLFNVTWCGGEGGWAVVNVGNDDFELKWRDSEAYTIGTAFPAQLVGRLTAQT